MTYTAKGDLSALWIFNTLITDCATSLRLSRRVLPFAGEGNLTSTEVKLIAVPISARHKTKDIFDKPYKTLVHHSCAARDSVTIVQ